jgi:hypothetical protein
MNKSNTDIDTILNEAAKAGKERAEMESDMQKTAVLHPDHEDVQEFLSCAAKLAELAKRNGWVLTMASAIPISSKPGTKGLALACATQINGSIVANTFSVMQEKGLPAAMLFNAAAMACSQFCSTMEQLIKD